MEFNSFSFKVDGAPISINKLYYNRGRRARILSREGERYKHTVGLIAKSAMNKSNVSKLTVPVAVLIRFYFKTRASDADNCLKAVLDSLSGIVWEDDRQVADNTQDDRPTGVHYSLSVEKWRDARNPRTEIQIHYSI